ncbi:MAG: YqiA/YcfP family alpha/beta fold hydrolase [Succinivibrio sp.]
MKIAYVHGYMSGPQAVKKTVLEKWLLKNEPSVAFDAPQYPDLPREGIAFLDDWARHQDPASTMLVGSSMGGLMSTVLQARFGFKIALLNPCIHPQEYFDTLSEEQVNPLTGETFRLDNETRRILESLDKEAEGYDPSRTRVYLQSGDEVLDYRKSLEFYKAARPVVMQGGCHRFEGFEGIIPDILAFFRA